MLSSPVTGADADSVVAIDTAPQVTVTRADGTVLAEPTVSAVDAAAGLWQATLTAEHTERLDTLTLDWTADVDGATWVERQEAQVVGGRWVTVAQMRRERGIESRAQFPGWRIDEEITALEDLVESWHERAWVPRASRETIWLDRSRTSVPLPARLAPVRSVRAVVLDGDDEDLDDWDVDAAAAVLHPSTRLTAGQELAVEVEHGEDRPPPQVIPEARRYLRQRLLSSEVTAPSDAISETEDGRTIRYSTPDARNGRPTGHLALDAAIQRMRPRVPGFA